MKYIQPQVFKESFTCPHCGAIAKQDWWRRDWSAQYHDAPKHTPLRVGKCQHCNHHTLWIEEKMYYPDTGNAPFPNAEMPKEVLKLYTEAASIQSKSPRGSAALLRLSIQVLCKELGESGKNINNDIANLVKKGLPEIVQQSLDIVRVTGNDAVHPGQIDTDDQETVNRLFELINIIIEYMMENPARVDPVRQVGVDPLNQNKIAP